jgi:hypothetical protein
MYTFLATLIFVLKIFTSPNRNWKCILNPVPKYKLSNDMKFSLVLDRCIKILQMCEKSLTKLISWKKEKICPLINVIKYF